MHYFLKERATKRLYAWWSLAIIDSVADLLPSLFSEKNGNKKVHTCCKRNRTIQMCFSSLSLRGKMKFVSAILLPIPHPLLVFSKSSDQQLIFNDILHYNFPSCNITNREKKNLLSIHHTSKETNICLKKKKKNRICIKTNQIRIAKGSNPFRNAARNAPTTGNPSTHKANYLLKRNKSLSPTCENSING